MFCKNFPGLCMGGFNSGNNLCFDGHIGALCEVCDLYGVRWGESWAPGGPYKCGKCSDAKYNNHIIGVMTFVSLIQMILAVKG